MPFNNSDREFARSAALPDWMREFAENELKKEGNPFEDIRNLFQQKNDVQAVEKRVQELCERIGLDKIEKTATIHHVERAKERGEGTIMKWCVYPKGGGDALGCHETKEGAEKQLQAIEANKADDTQYVIQPVEDDIFGGMGDGEPDDKFDLEQLEKGIKIELEHTNDPNKAKEIAKDHLTESKDFKGEEGGKYYDKLDSLEEDIKEELTDGAINKKKAMLAHLIRTANKFEANGQVENAKAVDDLISKMAEFFAKDKQDKKEDKEEDIFEKHPKLQSMIDNICISRAGFVDVPAILHMLQNEKNMKFSEKDRKQLEEYISKRKEESKRSVEEDDDISGMSYVVFVVNEDDGNSDIFNDTSRM